jgi:mRNA interferase MazF
LIDSKFSAVVCAPVYTNRLGLSTQLDVGSEDGLEHDSSIHCDELASLPKSTLADYTGSLSASRLPELDEALRISLDLRHD